MLSNFEMRPMYDQFWAIEGVIHLVHYLLVMAPTRSGIGLSLSGSLLDPPELLEIQIGWVLYHTTCGYVTRYMIKHPSDLYFK
jgi:hypothetical protein